MAKLSDRQMLTAIEQRDAAFDGQFYYGVITTGVFCLPSCPTKAAKPENIRLFTEIKSAVQAGFRPCKRCNPSSQDKYVDTLIEIARYIESHLNEKITLNQLSNVVQISPSQIQRTFKRMFGVSPKQYQDEVRMQRFKQALKQGEDVTGAIYSSGFGSASRIYGEASRSMGMTPKAYRSGGEGETIYYASRETVLGYMVMAATDKGVCSVQFADDKQSLISLLANEFPNAKLLSSPAQESPELDNWIVALDQHISLGAPRPNIPIDIKGTVFQLKVWRFLLSIKEGEVVSYSQVAQQIDNPKAVRAVGSACGKNRIAVLIPCHRVLRGDGNLGGYRWGVERKRRLLDMENNRGGNQ